MRKGSGRKHKSNTNMPSELLNMDDVIAWLARHGETDLNASGKFRAWLNPPLNAQGRADAKQLAEFFDGMTITQIVSDDLKRCTQTANIISAMLGVEAEIDSDLRPWNLGDLAGKDKKENANVLQSLLDNPDSKPPGENSESLNEFKTRNKTALRGHLRSAETNGPIIIITHTSNIVSVVEGEQVEKSEIVQPGDVVAVRGQDGDYEMEIICCEDAKK